MKYSITCLTKPGPGHTKVAPTWLTTGLDSEEVTEFTKSFDTVGLKNFTATAKMKPSYQIGSTLDHLNDEFENDYYDLDGGYPLEAMASINIRYVVSKLRNNLSPDGMKIVKEIKDDRDLVMYKAGTSVKPIVADMLLRTKKLRGPEKSEYGPRIENLSNIFSTKGSSHKIVFSTHPWDILTMSMRGIESCMEWSSHSYAHCRCLIGSMVDPYVGIIYATNEAKTPYGQYMTYRSVVRLVKSKKNSKAFHLYVEGAYPKFDDDDYGDGEEPDMGATEMFREVLAKKIKGTRVSSVVDFNKSAQYVAPWTKQVRDLEPDHRTYFDSSIRYA